MRSIALQIDPLQPEDTGATAYDRFAASPDCPVLPVIDSEGRPIGIVERNDFLMRFAGQFGRAVFGTRPITLMMETHPIIVDADTDAGDFAETALHEFSDRLLKGFVVTEAGRYFGVGAVIDLLKSAVRERALTTRRLERLANSDALTGLANRAYLYERLNAMLARPNRELALLAIDMDGFKAVNDTLGHSAGDAVLCEVADRLRSVLRPADLASRLGGDEFAVTLVRDNDAGQLAEHVADRVLDAMRQPFAIEGKMLFLGCSIGIAVYPEDGLTSEDLMRSADIALYRAKADGKGVAKRFAPALRERLEERDALGDALSRALDRGEISVALQPILRLRDDRVTAYEALMRWNHPELGAIPPSAFIPIAEEIGLIARLGQWMIHEACRIAHHLPGNTMIAVNISSIQFRLPGLVPQVMQALATWGLAPGRLELEITESVLIGKDADVMASIRQLRALGVRIALDDFGTGYASFDYLQHLPLDTIKIDRGFTAGLPQLPVSRAIVSAIAVIGRELGLRVTAEGIETTEQLDAVRALGCDQAQGYLISHPLPVDEVCGVLPAHRAA